MFRTQDPAEILKQLDEQEARAFGEFQEAQKAKREKTLNSVLQPLKERRGQAAHQRNELDLEISELDRQIARLLGRAQPRGRTPSGKRRNKADKLQVATVLFGMLKQYPGKRYASRDLAGPSDGIAVRDLVKVWNDAHRDKPIEQEGKKINTRYYVGK